MRPPHIMLPVAVAYANLISAALVLAAIALVAMLLASLRAQSAREDRDESSERPSGLHIFGPDEDEEPLVHVPVLSTRVAPTRPAPAAHVSATSHEDASRALDRIAAFASRQAYVPSTVLVPAPVEPAVTPPSAPVVRWKELTPLQPADAPEPIRSLPAADDVVQPRFSAPTADAAHGELPLDGDILLVEDDGSIADLYRLLLHTRGYASRHAHDGVEGIAMVREERPALILLDMMMPRMDGIQFLEALRSWPKTSAIPVVVLTNTDTRHLVERAMSLGAIEYLVKAQTRPQVLVGALPHWLRGNRALSAVS